MSSRGRLVEQWCGHGVEHDSPVTGSRSLTRVTTWVGLQRITLRKANPRDSVPPDSLYRTFWKGQDCRDGGQMSGHQGAGGTVLLLVVPVVAGWLCTPAATVSVSRV